MFVEKEIPIYDLVHAISEAVDLVSPLFNSHHQKVAYLSYRIAKELQLPDHEIQDIILASMLHDIGAFSIGERIKTLEYESYGVDINEHALMGYNLLKGFAPLAKAARLIKYHSTEYENSASNIPMGSCIIHLADRVCALLNEQREIFAQVPWVLEKIAKKNYRFHPDCLNAFSRLVKLEYFWLEVFSSSFSDFILRRVLFSKKIKDLEMLRNFAKVIGHIIDFRSISTATHSSGVAAVAMDITVLSGFSESECKLMEIAGFLHDIGKLTVPSDILEKSGKLSKEEFNTIRKHPYYTYAILRKIDGLEDIAVWAAHHHERHDGNGYPFQIKGEEFSTLARVMAVADVFTALTEDRPYRMGMKRGETVGVLLDMAKDGSLDKAIVALVNKNFFRINDVRVKAQLEARNEYITFYETTNQLITSTMKTA
jgi:HD-GYP domain-containing protein (c-di-GMP phosphodiesterase class II)